MHYSLPHMVALNIVSIFKSKKMFVERYRVVTVAGAREV